MSKEIIKTLSEKAKEAAQFAYAKYSNFRVGAAFIDRKGNIYTGCNVENKSFGLTNCAERTAIYTAIAQGCDSIDTLVVYTETEVPTAPCGACRQVIAEFDSETKIISTCDSDLILETTISELLPNSDIPLN